MFDFTAERSRQSIKKSLELLQLDYIDVIQVSFFLKEQLIDLNVTFLFFFFFSSSLWKVHDIEFAPSLDIILTQTLPELSRQVADGRARYIGVTGYPISVLKECIERTNIKISCVLSYSRFTLIDDTLVNYIPFFKVRFKKKITYCLIN